MFSQNTLIGRLGGDPEVKYTKNDKAYATFSVATSKKYKDSDGEWQEKTNWHRVVVWGGSAEACGEYLHKGSLVAVIGEDQTRKWEDDDGNDRYTTEVVVSGFDGTKVIFLDCKKDDDGERSERKSSKSSKRDKEEKKSSKSSKKNEDSGDDPDIPF